MAQCLSPISLREILTPYFNTYITYITYIFMSYYKKSNQIVFAVPLLKLFDQFAGGLAIMAFAKTSKVCSR